MVAFPGFPLTSEQVPSTNPPPPPFSWVAPPPPVLPPLNLSVGSQGGHRQRNIWPLEAFGFGFEG